MPHPLSERQSLKAEPAEIPRQIAAYRQELENASYLSRARRERLEWQIREREKRLTEVEAWLAAMRAEERTPLYETSKATEAEATKEASGAISRRETTRPGWGSNLQGATPAGVGTVLTLRS